MELKEGMYVRYLGNIAKVIAVLIDGNSSNLNRVYVENETLFFSEIEKASFDLIDLIEVGDYVNGYKVKVASPYMLVLDNMSMIKIEPSEIKNIVTKEQFEACKYLIERDK